MPTGYRLSCCKACGREVEHRSALSTRGKCPDCAEERIEANIRQLVAHNGPWFDHWRRAMAEAFKYVLPESPQPER